MSNKEQKQKVKMAFSELNSLFKQAQIIKDNYQLNQLERVNTLIEIFKKIDMKCLEIYSLNPNFIVKCVVNFIHKRTSKMLREIRDILDFGSDDE